MYSPSRGLARTNWSTASRSGVRHTARRPVRPGFSIIGGSIATGVNVGLFHGSEQGGFLAQRDDTKQPHAPFRAEQVHAAALDHAIVGHYHHPHDGEFHTYPGSPVPLTFGEPGGALVQLEVADDGSIARTRHVVWEPDVHVASVDLTGCSDAQEIRGRVSGALVGLTGIARATLVGEVEPTADLRADDLRQAAPWLEHLVVDVASVHIGYAVADIARESTVRGQFVRDVLEGDLTDDMRRRVLVTGLRALDGRADLEVA